MTIARPNTAASLSISIENYQSINPPVQLITASFQRFWWHTKSYGIIFSIMLLTLMSLIFVSIHWSYRKLLVVSTQPEELDLESSK